MFIDTEIVCCIIKHNYSFLYRMTIKIKKISRLAAAVFLTLFSFVFAFGARLILGNDSRARLSTLDKQAKDVFGEYTADNVAHADTPGCAAGSAGSGDSAGSADGSGDGGGGGDGGGDY